LCYFHLQALLKWCGQSGNNDQNEDLAKFWLQAKYETKMLKTSFYIFG
jgi:hypothetical protein